MIFSRNLLPIELVILTLYDSWVLLLDIVVTDEKLSSYSVLSVWLLTNINFETVYDGIRHRFEKCGRALMLGIHVMHVPILHQYYCKRLSKYSSRCFKLQIESKASIKNSLRRCHKPLLHFILFLRKWNTSCKQSVFLLCDVCVRLQQVLWINEKSKS